MSRPRFSAEELSRAAAAASDVDGHLAAYEKFCNPALPFYRPESVSVYWEALMEALERHRVLAEEVAAVLVAEFGKTEPWFKGSLETIWRAHQAGRPDWSAIYMIQLFDRGGSDRPPAPRPPRPVGFWQTPEDARE